MNHSNHYTHPELVQLARFLRVQPSTPPAVQQEMNRMVNVHSFTCEQKKYIADHANRWSQRSKVSVRSILNTNVSPVADVN